MLNIIYDSDTDEYLVYDCGCGECPIGRGTTEEEAIADYEENTTMKVY